MQNDELTLLEPPAHETCNVPPYERKHPDQILFVRYEGYIDVLEDYFYAHDEASAENREFMHEFFENDVKDDNVIDAPNGVFIANIDVVWPRSCGHYSDFGDDPFVNLLNERPATTEEWRDYLRNLLVLAGNILENTLLLDARAQKTPS